MLWTHWDSVKVDCKAGIQLHKIRPFSPEETPFVKVEIVRCFGARQCYLNRLYLHGEEAEDLKRALGCPGCHGGNNNKGKYKRVVAMGDKKSRGFAFVADTRRVSFDRPDLEGADQDATSSLLSARRRRTTIADRGYRDLDLVGESLPTASPRCSRRSAGGRVANGSNLRKGTSSNRERMHQQSPVPKRDFAAELKALDQLIQSPVIECSSKRSQRFRTAPRTSKFQVPREERVGLLGVEVPRRKMDACYVIGDGDESDRTGDRGDALSAVDLRTSYDSSETAEETKEDKLTDGKEGGEGIWPTCSSARPRKLASWAAGNTAATGDYLGSIDHIQSQHDAQSGADSNAPSRLHLGEVNVSEGLALGGLTRQSYVAATRPRADQVTGGHLSKTQPPERCCKSTPPPKVWLPQRERGQLVTGGKGERMTSSGDVCITGITPGESIVGSRGDEVETQVDGASDAALRHAVALLHEKVRAKHVLAARFELQRQTFGFADGGSN